MIRKIPKLSRAYRMALREYLNQAPDSDISPARDLGVQAMGMGLKGLDLARLHEDALIQVVMQFIPIPPDYDLVKEAGLFFDAVIHQIEGSDRISHGPNTQLLTSVRKLQRKTLDLATANKKLKSEIVQRKAVEKSLRISKETTGVLLLKAGKMQDELRFLSRRLFTVQEEERKRISRELHDVVAQTLTGIKIRLSAMTLQTAANSSDIHKKIFDTQQLIENSVDIVHQFARDLRPTVLDDLGLIPALKSYLKDFTGRSGIPVELTSFKGVEKLTGEQRTALYRIAQEALMNVQTHSKATQVEVVIKEIRGVVRMEIRDNGKGFKVDPLKITKNKQRLGLLGMRERIEMINGTFCVESEPDKGTVIRVELPQSAAAKNSFSHHHKSGDQPLDCP
jgi:signal transduction histidine kinase